MVNTLENITCSPNLDVLRVTDRRYPRPVDELEQLSTVSKTLL